MRRLCSQFLAQHPAVVTATVPESFTGCRRPIDWGWTTSGARITIFELVSAGDTSQQESDIRENIGGEPPSRSLLRSEQELCSTSLEFAATPKPAQAASLPGLPRRATNADHHRDPSKNAHDTNTAEGP
jgi:hypothetical protein